MKWLKRATQALHFRRIANTAMDVRYRGFRPESGQLGAIGPKPQFLKCCASNCDQSTVDGLERALNRTILCTWRYTDDLILAGRTL
jgi:hypothetical protein